MYLLFWILLTYLAFRLFTRSISGSFSNGTSSEEANSSLIVLIALVLKADGDVRRSELDYVKQFLLRNYGEEKGNVYLHRLRDLLRPGADLDVASECRTIASRTNYVNRYHMVDFLFGLATADGVYSREEDRVLREIATALGVSGSDFLSIYSRHVASGYYGSRQQTGGGWYGGYGSSYGGHGSSSYGGDTAYQPPRPDPYQVLGLQSTATNDEVKKAYRSLAKKYHPDKVEGMGEEVKKASADQFRKINEAYEEIRAARGMK